MANCYNDCIHSFVCQYVNNDEYPSVQQLKDDCRYCNIGTDVVPKSEYDRLEKLFNDMTQEAKGYLNRLYGIRAEVAREIFEEVDVMFLKYYNKCSEQTELKLLEPLFQAERFIINEMWHDIAELKKKYTEGEPNG